jgi:hypothetical protein
LVKKNIICSVHARGWSVMNWSGVSAPVRAHTWMLACVCVCFNVCVCVGGGGSVGGEVLCGDMRFLEVSGEVKMVFEGGEGDLGKRGGDGEREKRDVRRGQWGVSTGTSDAVSDAVYVRCCF